MEFRPIYTPGKGYSGVDGDIPSFEEMMEPEEIEEPTPPQRIVIPGTRKEITEPEPIMLHGTPREVEEQKPSILVASVGDAYFEENCSIGEAELIITDAPEEFDMFNIPGIDDVDTEGAKPIIDVPEDSDPFDFLKEYETSAETAKPMDDDIDYDLLFGDLEIGPWMPSSEADLNDYENPKFDEYYKDILALDPTSDEYNAISPDVHFAAQARADWVDYREITDSVLYRGDSD